MFHNMSAVSSALFSDKTSEAFKEQLELNQGLHLIQVLLIMRTYFTVYRVRRAKYKCIPTFLGIYLDV